MNILYDYLTSLVKKRFHGSVKILFEDGLPVSLKEEKSIDTAIFRENIKENIKRDPKG
jgi:hypothetical protein